MNDSPRYVSPRYADRMFPAPVDHRIAEATGP